jgi:cytidylate kinase
VIAIDGGAASGKSTVGSLLARRLGYTYFDTGIMYRAVTWAALERGIPIEDEPAVTALAEALVIQVKPPTQDDGRQVSVYADGCDVTWAIRQPAVDAAVSPVSAYPGVRRALTAQQRRIAAQGRIVMVGRDIGTVVLPHADLKLYVLASVEERARRRDRIDSQRAHAPMRPADDAVIIDTDGLDVEGVMACIELLLRNYENEVDVECQESC